MAKKNCEICGAEIGLLKQVQLLGGSYICRECLKKTNPLFDNRLNTLDDYKAHMIQLERSKKLDDAYFIKNKDASSFCAGKVRINAKAGLISFHGSRGGFMMFGNTELPVVFRIADIRQYEMLTETSRSSDGKQVDTHFLHILFVGTPGMHEIKMQMSRSDYNGIDKKLNECFGGRGLVGGIMSEVNKTKSRVAFAKDVVSTLRDSNVKDALTGKGELDAEAAQGLVTAVDDAFYVDRRELVERADAAIKAVLG